VHEVSMRKQTCAAQAVSLLGTKLDSGISQIWRFQPYLVAAGRLRIAQNQDRILNHVILPSITATAMPIVGN
jgi:hypothetical protein